MSDINVVVLTGRLTRDSELRVTPNGASVCKFGFACGRKYRDRNGENQEKTVFVDVQLWGKFADSLSQYLLKGKQLAIRGRLEFDSWEKDGQRRSKVYVTAEDIQLLGGKQQVQQQQGQSQQSGYRQPPAGVTRGLGEEPLSQPLSQPPSWEAPDLGTPPF